MSITQPPADAIKRAKFIREKLPTQGLFAGATWRIAPEPVQISRELYEKFVELGTDLLAFYRACNLLYRFSLKGTLPAWIAQYLDAGKPEKLIEASRSQRFKSEIPRVIRPDVLLTNDHFFVTELDSVPGGIGLTAWLNQTYSELGDEVIGGASGMLDGFKNIFHDEPNVVIYVSEESATYLPEMEWLGEKLGFRVVKSADSWSVSELNGAVLYRFFELFDTANVPRGDEILQAALRGEMAVTPPFKPQLEEKMLFAFLHHPQLALFWRQELGEKTYENLKKIMPYTWILDPTPLPPHAIIPELGIHDWREMAKFSQKQRELVLKISGFHPHAWGARGVFVGHDMAAGDWADAIDLALREFEHHPYILQRFERAKVTEAQFFDFDANEVKTFSARARFCPYYFVAKNEAKLGGILATVCPADKKLLHGMPDAVMAPCRVG
jgi:hypothetical protein